MKKEINKEKFQLLFCEHATAFNLIFMELRLRFRDEKKKSNSFLSLFYFFSRFGITSEPFLCLLVDVNSRPHFLFRFERLWQKAALLQA